MFDCLVNAERTYVLTGNLYGVCRLKISLIVINLPEHIFVREDVDDIIGCRCCVVHRLAWQFILLLSIGKFMLTNDI